MQFLSNTDAISVDLRNSLAEAHSRCRSLPATFSSIPTHLIDMEFRGDNYTDHYWTAAWLPGKRLAEIPMYVLTSADTFSGAEVFAYRFKRSSARQSFAKPPRQCECRGHLDVAPFFRVWMPMGRPVDRDTDTNWEGTGVSPDIKTSAQEALAIAHFRGPKKHQD